MHETVPVIDLGGATPSAAADERAAIAIDRACIRTGFFLVTGHGVAPETTARLFHEARAFFRLPQARRLKSLGPGGPVARGYTPLRGEALGPDDPADAKEMLDFGPSWATDDIRDQGFYAPDIWPEDPPGLKAAVQTCDQAMHRLARHLLHLFALALGADEDVFIAAHRRNISALRLICYPEGAESDEGDAPAGSRQPATRGGAHTDYGSLTILTADNPIGGLQIWHRDEGWIDVAPAPGQLVVNIGDVMPLWTGERWVSAPHRVVSPPPAERARARRHSIAFFHQPDPAAIIAPLPCCASILGQTPTPPITYGAHWRAKWQASRRHGGTA